MRCPAMEKCCPVFARAVPFWKFFPFLCFLLFLDYNKYIIINVHNWEALHWGRPKSILTISVLSSFVCWAILEFVHSLDIHIQVSKGLQTHAANVKFFHAKEMEMQYSASEGTGLRAKYHVLFQIVTFSQDVRCLKESSVLTGDWRDSCEDIQRLSIERHSFSVIK